MGRGGEGERERRREYPAPLTLYPSQNILKISNCKYETDDEPNRGGEGERERRREFGSTFHPTPNIV
jgi:hypothetical protein